MAFELWELLKESIIGYAGLSPVIVITLVALGFASSYVVLVMFGSSPRPKHQRSSDFLKQEAVKDKTQVPPDRTSSQLTGSSSPLWDVFLSFRGKDTRINFISNLSHALHQAGIETFVDDPALEKGEEISPALCNAIKNSKMFVVVISENYADSSWCLDELVEILRCKRTKNQVVPVFYYVYPSDLRHHKRCFGEALKKHKKHYSVDRIKKWKSALTEISDLSGYHLEKAAKVSEAETIQKIVENVVSRCSKKVLNLERYLVGIDSAVEEISQQLSMDSNDVRALGICGMGGIGKTTTAKSFYNKYSYKFDISCFMEDVKQYSQGGSSVHSFLRQLLIELLRVKDYEVRDDESALRKLKEILCSKKALIVLDDLDESSYSELLVKICKLFSDGSRVIITARDASLPNKLKVELSQVDTYMVKQLEEDDSLELFSYHAFEKATPPENYLALSESFVTYAGGLPLALKVLGTSLCGRTDVSFWKAKLEKVREFPMKDIQNILQLSYDELDDETQKAIFLDVVFFFVGKNRDEAVHVFKSCGFFPDDGISILVERGLLTIDEDNNLQMHNLIQDMGKKVIREESKHGKCQRLYLNQEEARQALQNPEGMDKIEGLILDFTTSTIKYCNAEILKRLPNLRLLKLIDVHDIKGNFEASFHELRFISWHGCTLTQLTSMNHLENLVILDMPYSRFTTLWKDAKLPSLHRLNLDGCQRLKELPESIGQLTKLVHLNVRNCAKLKRLPKPIIQLTSLGCLDMSGCSMLKLLPEQLGDMKGLHMLDASSTAIKQLPDSIAHLKKLIHLNLCCCKKLRKLPKQFGNMDGLEIFNASGSAIEQLPNSFSNLLNLVHLDLSMCTDLTSLPDSIWKLKSLLLLNLNNCSQLNRLPEQLGYMQCLEKLDASGTAIEKIPDSIGLLPRIQSLNFSHCKKLTYVPNSISNLTSLVTLYLENKDIGSTELPDAVENTKLEYLENELSRRVWLPRILSFSSRKVLPSKPFGFSKLFNLEHLVLTNCTSHGSPFPELPPNLKILEVRHHASLVQVPDLTDLKQLEQLYIEGCRSLQSLEKLPPHLLTLTVCDCTSLQHMPDLSMLRDLARLNVTGNGSTLKVILQDTHLQVRQDESSTFKATVQNREIPEWFNYKSSGWKLCFEIPSILGDNFVGIAFWIVYKSNNISTQRGIEAFITNNKSEGTRKFTFEPLKYIPTSTKGVLQTSVQCIRGDDFSIKSGDQINVFFCQPYIPSLRSPGEMEWEVKKCGAHLILKTPSSSTSC